MSKIFVGNQLRDGESANLSVLGRGFAFGFGVFETIKFLDRQPCFWEEHLSRLRAAIEAAGFHYRLDAARLRDQAAALFDVEKVDSGIFKIVFCDDTPEPKIFIFIRSRELETVEAPVKLVASDIVKSSKAFTSRYKSLNYMESILALENAKSQGFDECVYRNEYGQLTECAVANLFWVEDGVLKTPELDCGLLDGIVRAKVLGIAEKEGIPYEVGAFVESDLLRASEVFLTSSGKGPRTAMCYQDSEGRKSQYSSVLIDRIRAAFYDLENQSIRRDAV